MSPKDFLLAVMRHNETPLRMKLEAAKSAAPFFHAKLQNIELSMLQRRTLADYSDAELRAIANAGAGGVLLLEVEAERLGGVPVDAAAVDGEIDPELAEMFL